MCEAPQSARDSSLAIVVPVYRNASSLEELYERIKATLSAHHIDFSLVFVVDASPDNSWAVIEKLAARDKRVRGVLLEKNIGQHAALMTGLALSNATFYAVMDADMQDPPERLFAMLTQAQEGNKAVFAARYGNYQSRGRMLTSRLFKRLLYFVTGLPANAGTYFVIPRSVVECMLTLNVHYPQVVVMAHHCASSFSMFPSHRDLRQRGGSAYSGWGRVSAAWRSLRCAIECRHASYSSPHPHGSAIEKTLNFTISTEQSVVSVTRAK